jgi:hypothetical protein
MINPAHGARLVHHQRGPFAAPRGVEGEGGGEIGRAFGHRLRQNRRVLDGQHAARGQERENRVRRVAQHRHLAGMPAG